mgnify:CR=1 FL=1
MEDELPTSAIEGVTVQMGSIPDAVLHLRRGVIIQEQSYKMLVSAATFIAVSFCIWNLPFETPRVLLGEGPTLLQVASLGVLWGGICGVGGYILLNSLTQSVTVDIANGTVVIQSRDYQPEIPLSAVHCIQLCAAKAGGFQTNLVFRDTQNKLSRHCLYSHVRYELCQRLAHQYRSLCGFSVVDNTALDQRRTIVNRSCRPPSPIEQVDRGNSG